MCVLLISTLNIPCRVLAEFWLVTLGCQCVLKRVWCSRLHCKSQIIHESPGKVGWRRCRFYMSEKLGYCTFYDVPACSIVIKPQNGVSPSHPANNIQDGYQQKHIQCCTAAINYSTDCQFHLQLQYHWIPITATLQK